MARSRSLAASFGFAFAGLWYVLRTQRNARIHTAVALAAIAASLIFRIHGTDWAVLALAIGSVFAAELVNTALESLVDLVSPEYHELARIAKDTAAGAVLVTALASVAAGLCIFGPPLWRWVMQLV